MLICDSIRRAPNLSILIRLWWQSKWLEVGLASKLSVSPNRNLVTINYLRKLFTKQCLAIALPRIHGELPENLTALEEIRCERMLGDHLGSDYFG